MQYSNYLAKTEFTESYRYLIIGAIGNLLLMLLLIAPTEFTFLESLHAQFSLFSAIYILLIQRFFNWRNQQINLILLGFYVLILIVEMSVLGLPKCILQPKEQLSKGFLLQLMIGLSPIIYSIARLLTSIPILILIYKRWKFRENLIWK